MSPLADVAKVFTDAKAVDSRALNRAGVQPFRTVVARSLYKLRRGSDDPIVNELAQNGIVVLEDFLSDADFTAVEQEAEAFMAATVPTYTHHWGTTEVEHFHLTQLTNLTSDAGDTYPHLDRWREQDRVRQLVADGERRNGTAYHGSSLVERLTLGDYSDPDSQTDLHVDTFFNTHTIWLYLDDVTEANAPLEYVLGSHRIDWVRLRHDYHASVHAEVKKSRRVTDEEVQARGLQPRKVTCGRNTLVIANTCGYHRRSVGEPGQTRRSLYMIFRSNPFTLRG
jgi:hypothetical protein